MIWLLRDFDLLGVLLHAAALSLEAVLLGGVAFLLFAGRQGRVGPALPACCRLLQWSAAGLVLAEAATIAVTSASLLYGSAMAWRELCSAGFLRAEALTMLLALCLGLLGRGYATRPTRWRAAAMAGMALGILASVVALSHAASQMNHRLLLSLLTGLHHAGTAAWIGAMPYLLLSLGRSHGPGATRTLLRRYSAMAMVSVPVLVVAGTGMAFYYVGTVNGLYGSSYGLLVLAKIYLLLLMLSMGAGNWFLLRRSGALPASLLGRLRRFGEVELGLGFIVLLAAASLTAQSPSAEMTPQEMLSLHDYRRALTPQLPLLASPPLRALVPPTSLRQGVEEHQFNDGPADDANDKAWSDYNHHWAGLMVLLAGVLALLSRWPAMRWARWWPLSFGGLALFILLRADPEAWPLGPRPFWASFSYPDVLEHRLEAGLLLVFACFEAAVQAGRLRAQRAALVFPVLCACGAAVLLTHSHGLGSMLAEVVAQVSHTLIAVLGATAAGARWLELRLPPGRARRAAALAWPVPLVLVALVLLNYREV